MTLTESLGSADADWMAQARSEAAASLATLQMPSERLENWRYIDLSFDPGLDAPATSSADVVDDEVVDGWSGTIIRIVDGFEVTGDVPVITAETEDRRVTRDTDLFATAFTAYSPGAVLVTGSLLDGPVLVDVVATGAATAFPGVHIEVEPGRDASVFVRYRSANDDEATVVPVLTANVGDNARLDLTVVQDWNYRTRAIGRGIVTLQRDAGLVLSEVGLGALLGRLHLDVDFVGNGSHAKIYGAYFGEENQTLDYRYFMNHIGMHTRSDMFLKGAVEDEALSVFTGMIRIEETGQKTESFQTNKNLILSHGASAQSVPNLEILANDVKCGHGSSVGPLDEEQRYYLMSRGLTPERADRLQVHGFFEEVISEIPDEGIADWARTRINAKYVEAQEAGRV